MGGVDIWEGSGEIDLLHGFSPRLVFRRGAIPLEWPDQIMNQILTLFVSTFTTLLAIINPLEVMPVFLQLLDGKDKAAHRTVARKACTYAPILLFFSLIFGTLM